MAARAQTGGAPLRRALLLLLLAACALTRVSAISATLSAKPMPGLDALLQHTAHEAAFFPQPHPLHHLHALRRADTLDDDDGHDAGTHGIYGPHTFTQPLDHFHNTTAATFPQRYWLSTTHYRPHPSRPHPPPVFVVDGGETSGTNRIPFLSQGILDILAEATGGIAIVLEHRYYGTSRPRLPDIGNKTYWDVDALRWLTNEQALEDSARFMRHFSLPHLNLNLTAHNTPWIYIGGSYAGARAAHMRVLYPHLVFGAIATSAVTAAIDNFPQYYYPIARGADPACSHAIQAAVAAFDAIALPASRSNASSTHEAALRTLFDASPRASLDLDDLANLISSPLGFFQQLNWDPAVSSNGWAGFCDVMTGARGVEEDAPPPAQGNLRRFFKRTDKDKHAQAHVDAIRAGFARSAVPALRAAVHAHLHSNASARALPDPSASSSTPDYLPTELVRLASYVRAHFIEPCRRSAGDNSEADGALRACFSTKGSGAWGDFVKAKRLTAGKAWMWQVCTQWGYFQGAAPRQPSFDNNTPPPPHHGHHKHGGRIRPHHPPSPSSPQPNSSSSIRSTDEHELQRVMREAYAAIADAVTRDPEEEAQEDKKDDDDDSRLASRAASTRFTPGPRLVSALLDLPYTAAYCPDAFPSTPLAGVPDRPDVGSVNALGAFDVGLAGSRKTGTGAEEEGDLERLAIVNGQWDPWRPATPHSEEFAGGGGRADTVMRPFKLIPDCWHHCDQNGLPSKDRKAGKEPARIRKIHAEEVAFVRAWLDGWEREKRDGGGGK